MNQMRPHLPRGLHAMASLIVLSAFASANAGMLFEATLRDGDYGAGQSINTFAPNHGGSPGVPGIINGPAGTTFTATESDGRSNALLNWVIPAANRASFRSSGTVSLFFNADSATHVSGSLIGENYGFNAFRNGQGTYGSFLSREANGAGDADDTVRLGWNTWHNSQWTSQTVVGGLDYDRWYNFGFAWGGPDSDFEIWVDGELAASADLPAGWNFPWGFGNAGTNFGIGDNHERGVDVYGSTSGATFADIQIWDEYVPHGATVPEPATWLLFALGASVAAIRRRQ